ncbi:MAG: peptidoglycan recognition family protein [Christensenellaceae bacterium]
MQKIVQYTTQNDGYKKNGTLHVKGIMLHSTATPGILAKEFRDRFDKPGLGKSVHGFIDDVCYVQCLPYDKKAGHCRYSGNDTHIGIELCEPKEWRTDAAYFAKVYANAVQVFSELCREFSLSEADILDHAEGYRRGIASNHSDVGHWFPLFGKSMDTFRADVGAALRQGRARQRPAAWACWTCSARSTRPMPRGLSRTVCLGNGRKLLRRRICSATGRKGRGHAARMCSGCRSDCRTEGTRWAAAEWMASTASAPRRQSGNFKRKESSRWTGSSGRRRRGHSATRGGTAIGKGK